MEFACWNHIGSHGLNLLELACAAGTGETVIPRRILHFLRDTSFEDILKQAAGRQIGSASDPGGQLNILSSIDWNRLIDSRWPRPRRWAKCGWTMGFWTDGQGVVTPLAMIRSEFHPSNSGDCEDHPEPCAWFETVPGTMSDGVTYTSCDMIIGDEKTGQQIHLQTHNGRDREACGPVPRTGCTGCMKSQGHFFCASESSRYQKSTQGWINARSKTVRNRLLAVTQDNNAEGKLNRLLNKNSGIPRFHASATAGTFSRIGRTLDPGKFSFHLRGGGSFDEGLDEVHKLIRQGHHQKTDRDALSWAARDSRGFSSGNDLEKAQPVTQEVV